MQIVKRITRPGMSWLVAGMALMVWTACTDPGERPVALVEIDSTVISHVGYNPAVQDLTVVFRETGESYVYHGVPEAVHTGLVTSESPGRYFHTNVREQFEFSRVE